MILFSQILTITLLILVILPFGSLLKESDCWGRLSSDRFTKITRGLHFTQAQKQENHLILKLGCESYQKIKQNKLEFEVKDENKFKFKNINQ